MIKKNLKVAVCTLIMGILLGISTAVYAATVSSDYNYYGPVKGYDYKNKSYCTTYTDIGTSGDTLVSSDDSGNIPVGYMGVQGRLYYQGGTLKAASTWEYNDSLIYGFTQSTGALSSTHGTYYYSKGKTKAYNGDGYNTYWANATPNIRYP